MPAAPVGEAVAKVAPVGEPVVADSLVGVTVAPIDGADDAGVGDLVRGAPVGGAAVKFRT